MVLPKDELGAWMPMLFPGLGLGESETDWSIFYITPLGPELSRIDTRTRVKNASSWEFQKQEWRSTPFWMKNTSGKYRSDQATGEDDPMTSGDFTAEDIYACEQQQKSLKSPYFEVGASAEQGESPVREHQQIVLDYMEGRR
uniref:Rieske (2Fe-2S) protein n=1 Tax=uncultured Thiotrichaceae bacterium TaxID=298394 RepID=A0A6S6TAZ4_9GAMM|nr:MAG: Rieske (2Fe-2S) protein [uncultured Thiotrichaceae bacterium]